MSYGWEGERIRLVPLDRERHLENAVRWMNDPEVTAWTLVGDLPLTRLAEEGFFARQNVDVFSATQTDITFAIETLDGEHIGFSSLHRIDWRQGVAATGTILGRRDLWGRGYGSETARLRARYAFDVLGLRLLLSEAMADNAGSIGMLRRAGYREIGRIPRRYWKRGAYRDAVLFALERPG